jgi:uncharacterized protein YraI
VRVFHLCMLSGIAAFVLVHYVSATEVRVTGNRVNLRAGPSEQAEVISQASKGDVLVVEHGMEDEWIAIAPPPDVNLYVYAELIKDGIVTASKVKVRGGPGISYKPVGTLEKGATVKVRESAGEWLKIAPPSGTLLWINRKNVQPVPPSVSVSKQSPASSGESHGHEGADKTPMPSVKALPQHERSEAVSASLTRDVATNSPLISPSWRRDSGVSSGLALSNLVETVEQGKPVEYEGVVGYACYVLRRPSRYVLVISDKRERAVRTCYIFSRNESQFEALVGRRVQILGKEYWMQGVRSSVIDADRIALVNESDKGRD